MKGNKSGREGLVGDRLPLPKGWVVPLWQVDRHADRLLFALLIIF